MSKSLKADLKFTAKPNDILRQMTKAILIQTRFLFVEATNYENANFWTKMAIFRLNIEGKANHLICKPHILLPLLNIYLFKRFVATK